jgi:type II secretory pathway component GspD/PulD (secretin)
MLKDAVINYDSEHNALIAIGSYDVVARVQEFIDKIDRPIPQVLIEALVVDFNINKIREFGLSVFTSGPGDSAGGYPSESFLPTLNLKPGQKRTAQILKQVLRMLSIDRVITLPTNFRASINALETADVIKVHSTPQIATINGNPASITIGETRYYKLLKETMAPTTGNANTIVGTDERFEQKKFDTRLEVTPWVMDSGVVMVKIRPEFNIPRTGGDQDRPPTIDTRVLESMVRLRNGQTIVLGGQRQTERVVNSRGIPFLGSIPVLGWLFSNKTYSKNETQMMIFVTPRVYYGDEGGVKPDDYFGDEINRILDKMDPDKDKDERRKERKQRRHHKRSLRKRGAAESA